MNKKHSIPKKNIISFPNKDIMIFGLDHHIIDSPGLLMHTFLCRTITSFLVEKLPKEININLEQALNNSTFYHFSRQEADYGRSGISEDENTNEFMKDHSDMEYALHKTSIYGFDEHVTNPIKNYIINPKYREAYFPHETLELKGKINWTATIPMITSWLVAGGITNTNERFNDLRNRRSGEIGKLELDYIKMNLSSGSDISIPKPIIETAIKDSNYKIKNEIDIIKLVQDGVITNEIMGIWILNGFEEWADKVIKHYCELCGVDNFNTFLKKGLDLIEDNKEKKEEIKNEFEKFLGRKLTDSEYIPYIPGIEMIFKRLALLKIKKSSDEYKNKISKILLNIEKIHKRLKK